MNGIPFLVLVDHVIEILIGDKIDIEEPFGKKF